MFVYNMYDHQRLSYSSNFTVLMESTSGADELIQQRAELQRLEEKLEWEKEQQEWRSQELDKREEGIIHREDDTDRREEDLALREAIIKEKEIELGMIIKEGWNWKKKKISYKTFEQV